MAKKSGKNAQVIQHSQPNSKKGTGVALPNLRQTRNRGVKTHERSKNMRVEVVDFIL